MVDVSRIVMKHFQTPINDDFSYKIAAAIKAPVLQDTTTRVYLIYEHKCSYFDFKHAFQQLYNVLKQCWNLLVRRSSTTVDTLP
jgi:hypothetical protein